MTILIFRNQKKHLLNNQKSKKEFMVPLHLQYCRQICPISILARNAAVSLRMDNSFSLSLFVNTLDKQFTKVPAKKKQTCSKKEILVLKNVNIILQRLNILKHLYLSLEVGIGTFFLIVQEVETSPILPFFFFNANILIVIFKLKMQLILYCDFIVTESEYLLFRYYFTYLCMIFHFSNEIISFQN